MKKWIRQRLSPIHFEFDDGIEYWKEYIFLRILFLFVILGGMAYFISCIWALQHQYYLVVAASTLAYSLLLIVVIYHKVPLAFKYNVITYMALFLGTALLLTLGTDGVGFAYLIGYSILSALLFGLRGAIISVLVNLFLFLLIGIGLSWQLFDAFSISQIEIDHWYVLSFNNLPVIAVASVPLALIVNKLKYIIEEQTDLQRSLKSNIQQLKKARKKAVESDELKSMFLANISHEVRTPLNAMMGYTELLLHDMVEQEEEKKEYYGVVFKNGEYLLELMDNIVDASLIESDQLQTSAEVFNMVDLIEEVQQTMKRKINGHEVKLRFVGDVVSGNDLTINSDRSRVKQILINLINNAYKFTYQGFVEVGYDNGEDEVIFYVKDTGIGISKENQKFLFRRFVKGNQFIEGSGLGLSICKSLIESLGGQIWYETNEGVGTTFFFSLPKQMAEIGDRSE